MATPKKDKSWHKKVSIAFKQGMLIDEIAEMHAVTRNCILSSLIYRSPSPPKLDIGLHFYYKNEPYYSKEQEMLQEPQYKYKDLSTTEKEIYNAKRKKIRLW